MTRNRLEVLLPVHGCTARICAWSSSLFSVHHHNPFTCLLISSYHCYAGYTVLFVIVNTTSSDNISHCSTATKSAQNLNLDNNDRFPLSIISCESLMTRFSLSGMLICGLDVSGTSISSKTSASDQKCNSTSGLPYSFITSHGLQASARIASKPQ